MSVSGVDCSAFKRKIAELTARLDGFRERGGQSDTEEALQDLIVAVEELHAAEEELRCQNEQLAFAQFSIEVDRRRYVELFEFAPDAYLVTNSDGEVQEANRAACRLLNIEHHYLIGRSLSRFVYQSERSRFRRELREVASTDRVCEWTTRIQPYGHTKAIESVATVGVMRDTAGNPVALRWLVRDRGERFHGNGEVRHTEAELERRIAERTGQIEAASQAKDRFLAVLSHELRTPLTPVMLGIDSLAGDPTLPAEIAATVTMIKRNVDLGMRLVDDLLDLTRITRGKLKLRLESVEFAELVQQSLEICQADVAERRLTVDLQAQNASVLCDRARMAQVICNLIKNAVKFTSPGGQIELKTCNHNDRLLCSVTDNGVGIEAELLPRVFDAFEQDKKVAEAAGGLGLGLAIARAIVEAHCGTISVASDGPGHGSTFVVDLPTTPRMESPRSEQTSSPVASTGQLNLRVLLIEDNRDTALVTARLLRASGFDVSVAFSAAEALDLARHAEFHVLVSDLGLPDGNGLSLLQQIHELRPIKSIALSGFGTFDDLQRSREAGFDLHLTKPAHIQEIVTAIRRVTGLPPD